MREWMPDGFFLIRPTLSVFDPDGRLPLNLPRTGLAKGLPFRSELWQSQCEDFIAWTLASAPAAPIVAPGETHPKYPGFIHAQPRTAFAFTAEGSIPIESWAFQQISPSKVIFFPSAAGMGFAPAPNELFIPLDLKGAGIDARKAWFRCALGWNTREGLAPFETLNAMGRRTILRTSFYNELRKPGTVARFLWDTITVVSSNKQWTVLSSGICSVGRIDFAALLDSPGDSEIEGLTEYFEVSSTTPARANRAWLNLYGSDARWPISTVWSKFSTEVVIPYDPDLRKERHRGAYGAMYTMIEYYEKARDRKSSSHDTAQSSGTERH
jgi:hypothetical protein